MNATAPARTEPLFQIGAEGVDVERLMAEIEKNPKKYLKFSIF